MAPFSVGVAPAALEAAGGIYQYSERMLDVLAELRAHRTERFVVLGNGLGARSPVLGGHSWELAPLTPTTWRGRVVDTLSRFAQERLGEGNRDRMVRLYLRFRPRHKLPADLDAPAFRRDVHAWLGECGIDLMIYPSPVALAFEAAVPYVMAVHDLQHRIHPEFPEVSAGIEGARREYLFRHGIGRATLVIADSETGKEDILNFYGDVIEPDRVFVLPFLPSTVSLDDVAGEDRRRVRRAHRLPERYLFYPAQFWPHKNHERIVEAIATLARLGLEVPLVLVGSAAGDIRARTFSSVMAKARSLSVAHLVRHLGYVPADDMAPLYAEAVALVMPTFFGPTNIPILEAWSLDCAVLTSDLRGVREQAGDGALLVDPASADAIADGIRRLWSDDALRGRLIKNGRERLSAYPRDDYAARLGAILDAARARVESEPARSNARAKVTLT
jgi:glycosyltransferase involved in cell wall biosynthesis